MSFAIIIPIKNQDKIVRMCLDSIIRHNREDEVVLIDDGSTENSLITYLRDIANSNSSWKLFRNDVSQGHTRACELGIKNSVCENMCLLNSDTIVSKNSLKILSDILDCNKDVAVVGPKTSSASGPQLSLEAFSNRFKWNIEQIEEFARQCELLEEKPFNIDLVNGFCFCIKREVFNKIGGFCSELTCYGNEKELLIRVREAGYQTLYVPRSYVHHFGKMSYSHENINIGRAQKDADNWILKKHGRLK
jgi:hypothetical protein